MGIDIHERKHRNGETDINPSAAHERQASWSYDLTWSPNRKRAWFIRKNAKKKRIYTGRDAK